MIEYPNGQKQVRIYSAIIQENSHIMGVDEDGVILKGYTPNVDRSRKQDGERTKYQEEKCLNTSVNRSKDNIIQLARSNNWEWFVTLTFRPEECDRYDFKECRKRVTTFFNNLKKRKCPNVAYLGVPEQHDDGAWHFHVLVSGIDEITDNFTQHYKKGEVVEGVYRMNGAWSYGFDTISRVQDTKRVSNYILKYITKDMMRDTKETHRFFIATI